MTQYKCLVIRFLFLVILCVLSGTATYSSQSVATEAPPGWQLIDARAFTIYAPAGWVFERRQGIDSYVGKFRDTKGHIEMFFDLGWYSNSLDDFVRSPEYVVHLEVIDSYKARIVTPSIPGKGLTGMYLSTRQFRFNLTAMDLTKSERDLVLKIFKTIKFKSSRKK